MCYTRATMIPTPIKDTVRPKILIIDDDEDVCRVLSQNLADEGYETAWALSGQEGVAKAGSENFDLVILDLKLPDLHGTEALRQIKTKKKDMSVVILTGYPSVDTAVETMKDQAADYISKPFDVGQLRSVVQRELASKKAKGSSSMTEVSSLGDRIRQIRKSKSMSLGELAKRSELSKSYLSEVERRKKFPGLDALLSIARGLGVNIYLLFKD